MTVVLGHDLDLVRIPRWQGQRGQGTLTGGRCCEPGRRLGAGALLAATESSVNSVGVDAAVSQVRCGSLSSNSSSLPSKSWGMAICNKQ